MKKENLKSNVKQSNEVLKTRYRLPETTTPEDLECNWRTVLNFGNHVLLAGFYFANGKNNYFGAIFTFTTADHSCEGEIKLEAISTEMYPDNGSAIAWCIGNCR